MWLRRQRSSQASQALTAALEGTALAGRRVIELPIPGLEEVALAVPIESGELERVWREARERLSITGRWPLATVSWLPEKDWERSIRKADVFSRFYFDEAVPRRTAKEILDAADALTEAEIDEFVAAYHEECLEFEAEYADSFSLVDPLPDPWHPFTEHAALLFLPWTSGWDSLAYINFYESDRWGIAETIGLARRWEQKFGAELVAHFGTILECLVSRPPASLDQAVALAREQYALAPATFVLPGEPPALVAPALLGAERWFLHQRP